MRHKTGFRLFLPVILLGGFLLFGASSATAELIPIVAFVQDETIAGQATRFTVYFHNEGSEPITAILPHQLQLLITDGNGGSRQLSAFGEEPEAVITLPPGTFRKKLYSLSLPTDLQGIVRYRLGGFPGSEGVIIARAPEPVVTQETAARELRGQDRNQTLSGIASLYQSYSENFSTYQPTYFLVGTDPEKSKFQISFKYRLFNPSGSLSRDLSWLKGFHLAYTQTSYWDLDSDSAPFEDTSYMPELFYMTDNIRWRPSWMEGFILQAGVQHESNGRAGDFSRSTNYVYVKPQFIFYHRPTQLGVMISPRFLAYFNNDDNTNQDLDDYRGNAELEIDFGRAHSFVVKTNLRFAEEGTSVQTDLTYPIHRLLSDNLDLYFHIQYSNALAESLLNYRERVEAVRIGFSLVR